MADDQRYRPSRTERYLQHRAAAATPGRPSGDPLAELARLIGQDDSLTSQSRPRAQAGPESAGELTAGGSRATSQGSEPARRSAQRGGRYADLEAAVSPEARQDLLNSRGAGADPGSGAAAPEQARSEPYRMSRYDDSYAENMPASAPDEPINAYQAEALESAGGEADERAPAFGERRAGSRTGLLTMLAVLGLAILGTAAAFGYRAWTGNAQSPPPIIKASPEPAKVMAANAGEATAPKAAERAERAPEQNEQIVPREEEPVNITTRSIGARSPASPAPFPAGPAPTTGIVQPAPLVGGTPSSSEPRKVHTITIRPDLSSTGDRAAADPGAVSSSITPYLAAPVPPLPAATGSSREKARKSSTGATTEAAEGTATAAPPRPAAGTANKTALLPNAAEAGHYVVQVSAQRSEAEAEASFRSLQSKYPSVLGGRQPIINRADKGDKGIFYRAQVGPFGSIEEANQLCNSLKAAGGQCFVYRN